ncbi:uncharacterized protein [Chelonus insularis]|uniref:uncharacterized protein isoform X2 n=1 Tax=Chelonus insularis TaxID=460826 RepID=UPI00158B4A5A|nr:uncharacterized protein LOC118068821 isoform X2 [Chelonus insularis]
MSAAYTALSISVKMAPGSDNRQESVAPDKNQKETSVCDITTDISNSTSVVDSKKVSNVTNSVSPLTTPSDKQEEPAKLSTLNDKELEALLNEALTYTGSSRDREGKSILFKKLLQATEVDETEEGHRVVINSRCIPNTNRRKHKRDSISDRLTHGGSLQNLAQSLSSEFDSNFSYLPSGSSHTYGGGRRKNKKHTGPSVSARQREGGSLPSNVNASHNLTSFINLDLIFDKKRGGYGDNSVCDWKNEEKSKSLDKSFSTPKKEDEKNECTSGKINDANKIQKVNLTTSEMLDSDNQIISSDYKTDYMVINIEVNGVNERSGNSSVHSQRPLINSSIDHEDDEGTEMKIIEPRRPMQLLSCTTLETVETPVDSTIEFPLREHTSKQEKGKITINGTLQLTTYNNAKCNVSGAVSGMQQSKVTGSSLLPIMHVSGTQPNIAMAVSRLTAQNTTTKDFSMSIDKKSLDENGNAVQSHNSERKKTRRKHTQEPNVIVYSAENVEGHRNEDIDSLINFIESKESKGKKGKTGSNSVKVKSATGPKSRSREKDSKRESLTSKLQKSNSLEEISKTKLEDLTVERSTSSSGASSISSQHGTFNGGSLRRAKQHSVGDPAVDCRGDRRSWGTEEGQSIYCNDIGDDYINYTTSHTSTFTSTTVNTNSSSTRRNSYKKINPEIDTEPEFLIVTKKKKTKRQRRSSSGSRTQNLASSVSYLPRTRDFAREHRTQLSPELRRKSASSMPPSDKSDSSDSDSVHSLPVTSNTKHNLNDKISSTVSVSQASYADITRMANINLSPNSVLNISSVMPNMMTTVCWPSVSVKSPSEPDKFPQDYYPSLDELQQSDRKLRQHNLTNSNQMQDLNLSFDKYSSSTNSKFKNSFDSKKAEAREEAINKKIQVIKYVEEQKNLNANSDCNSSNQNEPNPQMNIIIPTNNKNVGNESNSDSCIRDSAINTKTLTNHQRLPRKNFQQIPQPPTNINQAEHRDVKKPNITDELKKPSCQQFPENNKKTVTVNANCFSLGQEDFSESKSEINNPPKPTNPKIQDELEMSKSANVKIENSVKSTSVFREPLLNSVTKLNNLKLVKSNPVTQCGKSEEAETKKSVQQNINKEKSVVKTVNQHSTKKNPRPAVVILMDDTQSNTTKSMDNSSELTFGFEVNVQLLQLEDSKVQATEDKSISESEPPKVHNKLPTTNTDRSLPPPLFDKHVKNNEKVSSNFHTQTPLTYQSQRHQVPHAPMIISPNPYLYGYVPRYQTPITYGSPVVSQPTTSNIDKYHPKEDFCARYIAPEENINIDFNHDKIVAFVGLAWDAIMREIPATETSGRVQYYSGQ